MNDSTSPAAGEAGSGHPPIEDPDSVSEKQMGGRGPLILRIIVGVGVVAFALFHLYTAYYGPYTALQQRVVHVSGICAILFIAAAGASGLWRRASLIVLAVLVALPALYICLNYQEIIETAGIVTERQMWLGVILIAAILVATRLVIGWPLVIIALVALAYAAFGNYLPPPIGHSGYSVERIVSHLFLTTEGVLGTPVGASATYIAIFVLFGALLQTTGMGDIFIGFGHALTGRKAGGPAYVAVISSALFGSINGSAVANVASTGTFTIPLMIRTGYKPQTAAAIEAAASSGGQIMPPIMGAAAFLMVSFTGIPYVEIIGHALFPALLYFGAVFAAVQLHAAKNHVRPISAEDVPDFKHLLITRGYMLLPVPILLYFLLDGYTPYRAGFYAIVAALFLSMFSKESRPTPKRLLATCRATVMGLLPVATACACAGIVIGMLTLTGLGLKLSGLIVDASGGSLFIALCLTAVTSIVLGMGLPTVGVYLLLAVLVAPALTQMGVPLIAAHLFIFYYGLVSAITPPVALAAYAAAAIAKSRPLETSVEAFLMGLAKVIVPFIFVYGPQILLIGEPVDIVIAIVSSFVGVYALSIATTGWWRGPLSIWRRVIVCAGSVAMMMPGVLTDLIAIPVIVLPLVLLREAVREPA
ncbi:TRAP transporter permease [Acuticoccus mangrovi]|uniref:TRAP transporter fused permease subunit n=1 Tax=Acuticoccus mangrovi TaxID=2796142 RepID=A0A934MH58_9HYPH|nr:TRAP transporter fused permease subunit [Acuticoccus mangrovi]MBJ3776605.1 TRAP transporter fused permease subunit [Acuticoccus mangrovi]